MPHQSSLSVKIITGGGHHGGVWKVAYADFVTAMRVFFMLSDLTDVRLALREADFTTVARIE